MCVCGHDAYGHGFYEGDPRAGTEEFVNGCTAGGCVCREYRSRAEQPQADAVCPACGHYGYDHLRLADMPPRCRCGCVDWDGAIPKFAAESWFTITGRGAMATIKAEQLPEGMLTATELLNQHVVIDGHVYRVTGVETCRVNHLRCSAPFGLLIG